VTDPAALGAAVGHAVDLVVASRRPWRHRWHVLRRFRAYEASAPTAAAQGVGAPVDTLDVAV
jgi:hypothetical protein